MKFAVLSFRTTLTWLGLALLCAGVVTYRRSGQVASGAAHPAPPQLAESYGKLPLSFEANQGQADAAIKFLSRGYGYDLALTAAGATLHLQRAQKQARLQMRLVNARQPQRISGAAALPGQVNYLLGDDPKAWRTALPTYGKVEYQAVYPGVDLVWYGNQQKLEYDFVVASGADPKQIRLAFAGAQQLRLDANGDLIIETGAGDMRQHRPVVYQEVNGQRQSITGSYRLAGRNEISFELGAYDHSQVLVIDPVLAYSTGLGVSISVPKVAVDASGHAYLTGATMLPFTTTAGALRPGFQPTTPAGASYVYVTKLNPTGTGVVYSALLGGTLPVPFRRDPARLVLGNVGRAIAVDDAGNAYVSGATGSANFPTTANALRSGSSVADDYQRIFALKLNATGSQILYATLLGKGTGDALALDAQGELYVAGAVERPTLDETVDFTTTSGAAQQGFAGGYYDAYLVKLNPTTGALRYATLLGSHTDDIATDVALDASGNAYLTGTTKDTGLTPNVTRFPQTAGAFRTTDRTEYGGVFVTKVNSTGSAWVYSTIVGAMGFLPSLAVDAAGFAYLTYATTSPDYPTTPGALQRSGGSEYNDFGNVDSVVTKLNQNGSALVYSTYLGEPDFNERTRDLVVDANGNAYLAGAFGHTQQDGHFGAFVTQLNAQGSARLLDVKLYSADPTALARDASGNLYVAALAGQGFYTTPGAYLPVTGTAATGCIMKLAESGGFALPPTPQFSPIIPNEAVAVGGRLRDTQGRVVPGVKVLVSSPFGNFERVSDAYGSYSGPISTTGIGEVRVITPGYQSSPPSYTFDRPISRQLANFTLTAVTPTPTPTPSPTPAPTPRPLFTISGRTLALNGQPIAGVLIWFERAGAPTLTQLTDANGNYSFPNQPDGGDYTLSASKDNIAYFPSGINLSNLSVQRTANFMPPPPSAGAIHASAATFQNQMLAPGSIIAAFGANLATATQVATTTPLPATLAGTRVFVLDSQGIERQASLFFVSPTQVNYLLPPETAAAYGGAEVLVRIINGANQVAAAVFEVAPVAPGLFSADASGRGWASAIALRVAANGAQSYEPLVRWDSTQNRIVAIPLDVATNEQVYLLCFGTGFRNLRFPATATAQLGGTATTVSFAGAQGSLAGLDQLNLAVPRSLAGRGEVQLNFSVDGRSANPVKVFIK